MNTKVAVYGTLRKGLRNHYILGDSIKLFDIVFTGFRLVDLGLFPAAIKTDDMSILYCEVYEVSQETLYTLDILEDHPDFYKRIMVNNIHLYIMPYEVLTKYFPGELVTIGSGDYKKYLKTKHENSL